MSVWEQRTNQLRKHNMKTSTEALFNELDPDELLAASSALHLHPDMKSHTDRPLVLEDKNGDQPRAGAPEEAAAPGVRDSFHSRRRHHHRDRNGDGGDGQGVRRHSHHGRSREHNADAAQDRERLRPQTGSPEEERGHRHHRSRRTLKEGNGRLTNGAQDDGKGRGDNGNGEKKLRSSRIQRWAEYPDVYWSKRRTTAARKSPRNYSTKSKKLILL